MAILYQAPVRRVRRGVRLVGVALSVGVALAWLLRSAPTDGAGTRSPVPAEAVGKRVAPGAASIASNCDARCVAAKVIGPATTACTAAVEEFAGFGVRWLDEGGASPRFDRFAWLQEARGTVTLAGGRAEFRNAAGAYTPVAYDCDFDPATLVVLEARARPRPRSITPGVNGEPSTR